MIDAISYFLEVTGPFVTPSCLSVMKLNNFGKYFLANGHSSHLQAFVSRCKRYRAGANGRKHVHFVHAVGKRHIFRKVITVLLCLVFYFGVPKQCRTPEEHMTIPVVPLTVSGRY